MRRALLLCGVGLIAFGGCYTVRSVVAPKIENMSAWRTERQLAVGAEPITKDDRQKAMFDEYLGEVGVLAVHVLVENRGDRKLRFLTSDATLRVPNGPEIGPTPGSRIASRFESEATVSGWTYLFGLPGYLISSHADEKAKAARSEDYRNKELRDVELVTGQSAHGFLYFVPHPGTPAFTDATLTFRAVDLEEATSFDLSLPLRGLDVKESVTLPLIARLLANESDDGPIPEKKILLVGFQDSAGRCFRDEVRSYFNGSQGFALLLGLGPLDEKQLERLIARERVSLILSGDVEKHDARSSFPRSAFGRAWRGYAVAAAKMVVTDTYTDETVWSLRDSASVTEEREESEDERPTENRIRDALLPIACKNLVTKMLNDFVRTYVAKPRN